MLKYRPIAHPDWLPEALSHMASLCRIEKDGHMPESIRFMMLENAADRILRACFSSRWSMLWYLFLGALQNEQSRIYGACFRFWRYKVQGKSAAEDWHRMMSSLCPRCKERHEIPRISEDLFRCKGCKSEAATVPCITASANRTAGRNARSSNWNPPNWLITTTARFTAMVFAEVTATGIARASMN